MPLLRGMMALGLALSSSLLVSCANYRTPGMGLAVHEMAESGHPENSDLDSAMQPQPAAMLPLRLVLVRIQRAGYPSMYEPCYGNGRYCVLTVREVESNADLEQMADLPQVASLIPIPRRLIPDRINTTLDVRRNLADAHIGDITLFYSIDTQALVGDDDAAPLSKLKKSLQVDQTVTMRSRITATLVDVRTGFIYLQTQTDLSETLPGWIWTRQDSANHAHENVERKAFHALVGEISRHWRDVITPLAWRP
ncbi:MAG: hypothetical protein AB3X41_00905 [Leptothrix ochracea]|uniref:hypothetical protein n=2 Tax=Leptothrix ochracea TaxID=735331 RepID=UPI0034E1FBE5